LSRGPYLDSNTQTQHQQGAAWARTQATLASMDRAQHAPHVLCTEQACSRILHSNEWRQGSACAPTAWCLESGCAEPHLDSASAYLPLYLFKRASDGPPSDARYLPCAATPQAQHHRCQHQYQEPKQDCEASTVEPDVNHPASSCCSVPSGLASTPPLNTGCC
jgi:hypothetical protein